MVSRLHEKSMDGHLSMLADAFAVPATQVDAMSSDRYLRFPCQETATSVGENQVVTIDIPGCESGSIYDLSKSYILVRSKFVFVFLF